MRTYTDSEKLDLINAALENGDIDIDFFQRQVQKTEQKKYLAMHPYAIFKSKDGYYCTYLPDKKNKYGRVYRKRKTKKEIENVIIQFWKGKEEFVSVEDVFNEWNDRRLKLDQISRATYDRNIKIFKRHFTKLKEMDIRDITPLVITDFLEEEIAEKKLSAKSFANLKGVTKGFLKRAQNRGLIEFSVNQAMADMDLSESCFKHKEKDDVDDVFTEEEFDQLVSYLKDHPDIWNLGILLILSSGLRVGELVTLKWSDFLDSSFTQFRVNRTETSYSDSPLQDGSITHQNTYEVKESPKTKAGRRVVTLPEESVWIIKELRKINPFGEYIFMRGDKRMTSNTIRCRLYRVCDKLGIERKSPHKGRKTYASILLDHGVDNAFITSQMGHTDISCTETYYHKDRKSNATKKAIVNGISEFEILGKDDLSE